MNNERLAARDELTAQNRFSYLKPKMAESFNHNELLRMLADVITHQMPLKDIETILNSGVRVNGSVHKGLRPLHYAAYENNVSVMHILIDHGAEVNAGDDVGYTPLHIASKYGNLRAVKFLLQNGAIVNFLDEEGPPGSRVLAELTVNPLSLALENDNPECADALLTAGANPNQIYFLGSELTLVPMKYTRCMEVLLAHGADANSYARSGMTALMRACREQQLATVKALLQNGADVNKTCHPKIEEKRAIHFAAIVGDINITKALIEAGADLHKPENFGYAPLEFAISTEKVEICKFLLESGADPNELNDAEVSPMQIACSTPDLHHTKELLELLLQHGAMPNYARQNFSYSQPCLTPLIEYFVYQIDYDIEVIRTLLAYGANVNFALPTKLVRIKDHCGVLVQVSKLKDRPDIFNLLVNAAESFNEMEIRKDRSMSQEQKEVLLEECDCPRPLRNLVRLALRSHFTSPILPKIKQLPLPLFLTNYMLFQT